MSGKFKLIFNSPKKGERLFKPISYIVLGDHSIKDGNHLVSPQMVESEVDGNIDALILNLENIRAEAKKRYKIANKAEESAKKSRVSQT